MGKWKTYSDGDTIPTDDATSYEDVNHWLDYRDYADDTHASGWGASEKGRLWWNTTDLRYKFWDGSAVQTLPGAGGGASYSWPHTYTVWVDGGTYYAMDRTGTTTSGAEPGAILDGCLGSAGTLVVVHAGDYLINSEVAIDKDNVAIVGTSPGAISSGTRFIMRGSGHFSIENTAGVSRNHILFQNLGFQDYGYYASTTYEAEKVIHGDSFATASSERIWDFQLRDCYFYRFTMSLGGGDYCVPVDLPNLEHAYIVHNTFYRGCKYLLQMYVADDYELGNNRIVDNFFGFSTETGIAQRAAVYTNAGVFSRGNQFLGSNATDSPVAYVVANGFTANIHMYPTGTFGPGDRCEGVGYLIVTGQDSDHKTKYGVVHGNFIYDGSHAAQNLLSLNAYCENWRVEHNIFDVGGSSGVITDGLSNSTEYNTFKDNVMGGNITLTLTRRTCYEGNKYDNPFGRVANFRNSSSFHPTAGNSAIVAASTDYRIDGCDCFITGTDSGSADAAFIIKDPAGTTVYGPVSTETYLFVKRGYTVNWGAFTGAAPTVTVEFC